MLNEPSNRISIKAQNPFFQVEPYYNLGPGAACGMPKASLCSPNITLHRGKGGRPLGHTSPVCGCPVLGSSIICSAYIVSDTTPSRPIGTFLLQSGAQIHSFVYGSIIPSSAWGPVICSTFSIDCSLFWERHISIWLCHIAWSSTTNVFEIFPCSDNC